MVFANRAEAKDRNIFWTGQPLRIQGELPAGAGGMHHPDLSNRVLAHQTASGINETIGGRIEKELVAASPVQLVGAFLHAEPVPSQWTEKAAPLAGPPIRDPTSRACRKGKKKRNGIAFRAIHSPPRSRLTQETRFLGLE